MPSCRVLLAHNLLCSVPGREASADQNRIREYRRYCRLVDRRTGRYDSGGNDTFDTRCDVEGGEAARPELSIAAN